MARESFPTQEIFWLRDENLEDSHNLPDPDVIAQEVVEDLEARSNNSAKWQMI